jgi:hypothetical protein
MTMPHRHDGRRRRTGRVVEGRTLLVTLLLVLPGVGAAAAPEPAARGVKTLSRRHDPVVIRTGLLAEASDRATARYRLFAAREGTLEPIPFQFDARSADGEFVLAQDGTETDFTFDDDDELVFMAKDAGDRVAATALPAGGDVALEIEVTDPGRGQHGWAYLVHFPDAVPPPSPVRYATFDTARQEARALSYEVSYSHDRSNFLTGIRIAPAAGGTGETLIARVLMRIIPTFSLLVKTWRPTLTEQSFAVVPDGLKNGAVRAVRRVRQSLDLGGPFPDIPNGKVYTFYYATSFTTPSTFSVPWLVLKSLRDFHFESLAELGAPDSGTRYWDAANPEGVPFTGAARPTATDADHDWWVVSGSRGTCLHALRIPDQWHDWGIKRGIVFRDQRETARQDLGAGYSLLRMTNLREAGDYELDSAFVVLPRPYRPGDEAEALAASREPLQTEISAILPDGKSSRSASAAP